MRCRQDKQWHWSNNSYLHTLQGSIDSTPSQHILYYDAGVRLISVTLIKVKKMFFMTEVNGCVTWEMMQMYILQLEVFNG